MKIWKLALLATIIVSLFIACDESDPVKTDADRFEPVGLTLYRNGSQAFKYVNSSIDTTLSKEILSDHSSSAQNWEARFFDATGKEIYLEDQYGGYGNHTFTWTIADSSIANVIPVERVGDYRPNFRIIGYKAGLTTIQFKILHNDHEDYTTAQLPLRAY